MIKLLRFFHRRAEFWLKNLAVAAPEDIRFLQGAYKEIVGVTEAIEQGPPEQETETEGLSGSYTDLASPE